METALPMARGNENVDLDWSHPQVSRGTFHAAKIFYRKTLKGRLEQKKNGITIYNKN